MILEILASCYMTWDAHPFLAVEDNPEIGIGFEGGCFK
jgi:hypothetical protein